MRKLGYNLTVPENRMWKWWVGMEELPKYVKTNAQILIGRVLKLLNVVEGVPFFM